MCGLVGQKWEFFKFKSVSFVILLTKDNHTDFTQIVHKESE